MPNWIVRVSSGKEYRLTEKQMGSLRLAIGSDKKFVDFGDFAVNVGFIERYWKEKNAPEFPEYKQTDMSEQKRGENIARLKEMMQEAGLLPKE